MERRTISRRGDRDNDRDDDRRSSSRDRNNNNDDRSSSSRRGASRDRDDDRGGRSAGRGGFVYRRRDDDSARRRATESSRDFDTYLRDDIKTFKAADGYNTIRILPPTWDDPEHFAVDIHVHYGIGPDEQAYLCAKKMKGEPCPICEEHDRARRAGEDEEYVKSLEPTRRSLFYLVDREDEKSGVQAWPAPFTKIDQAIVKVSIDRQSGEVLPIDDPEDGYDVEFDKGGKGIGTQYSGVAIARKSSPLGNNKWLDFAVENPLPDILVYHDYDHIKEVLEGGGAPRTRSSRDRADDRRGDRGRDDDRHDADRNNKRSRSDDGDVNDAPRGRKSATPDFTWESIHAMEGEELDALVEQENIDVDPNKADDDEELADWICKALGIEKVEERRRAGRGGADEDDGESRLARMRSQRRG